MLLRFFAVFLAELAYYAGYQNLRMYSPCSLENFDDGLFAVFLQRLQIWYLRNNNFDLKFLRIFFWDNFHFIILYT